MGRGPYQGPWQSPPRQLRLLTSVLTFREPRTSDLPLYVWCYLFRFSLQFGSFYVILLSSSTPYPHPELRPIRRLLHCNLTPNFLLLFFSRYTSRPSYPEDLIHRRLRSSIHARTWQNPYTYCRPPTHGPPLRRPGWCHERTWRENLTVVATSLL